MSKTEIADVVRHVAERVAQGDDRWADPFDYVSHARHALSAVCEWLGVSPVELVRMRKGGVTTAADLYDRDPFGDSIGADLQARLSERGALEVALESALAHVPEEARTASEAEYPRDLLMSPIRSSWRTVRR